jgi:hypothetical protein
VGAEASPLEPAPEVALLCGVTETRERDVKALWAEQLQNASDGLRTPDRQDGNALGAKIPTAALSERFERGLVADPFNEHDRTCVACCGNRRSTATASRPSDVCLVKSLLLVHIRIFTAHTQRTVADSSMVGRARAPSVGRAVHNRRASSHQLDKAARRLVARAVRFAE